MSDCQYCARLGVDHNEVVEACRRSAYDTATSLCLFERIQASWLHREIIDQIQEWIDEGKTEILLLIPRDFLKTTILAVFCIHWWLNDPEMRVGLFHSSSRVSAKLVRVVSSVLKSGHFLHYFPSLVPKNYRDVVWTSTEINVVRKGNYGNSSLEAYGVDSTTTGGHFDRFLNDDLVERGVCESEAELRNVEDFYRNEPSMYDRPEKRLTINAATLWKGGFLDLVKQNPALCTIEFGAEVDDRFRDFLRSRGLHELADEVVDGAPTWPEYFPEEILAEDRRRMGPSVYSRQRLNLPSEEEEMLFSKDDVRYYELEGDVCRAKRMVGFNQAIDMKIPLSRCEITCTVDPASGKSRKSDHTAINVSAFYKPYSLAFGLEDTAGNWKPMETIERLFSVWERWRGRGLRRIGIEEQGLQGWLAQWIENEQRRRNIHFPIDPISTGNKSKGERIREGLQPILINHQMYFLRGQSQLVQELLAVQLDGSSNLIGRSPNRVDALSMQAQKYWSFVPWSDAPRDEIPEDDEDDDVLVTRGKAYGLECSAWPM